jgi:hypothetical protein
MENAKFQTSQSRLGSLTLLIVQVFVIDRTSKMQLPFLLLPFVTWLVSANVIPRKAHGSQHTSSLTPTKETFSILG